MKTLIKQSPRQLFNSLFTFASQESWFKAREITEELTNRGASGLWLDLAYDLADGLKKIIKVSDNIFVLNDKILEPQERIILEEACYWVTERLQLEIPILLIEISPEGTPIHAITGIDGLGYIAASRSSLNDKSLVIHEITHCVLMSRSLFLDEGLATLFQHQVNNKNVSTEPEYWDRPSLAALVEMDWSNDPYFLKIIPNKNDSGDPLKIDLRVHLLAATVVDRIIQKNSLSQLVEAFQKIKPQLREGRTSAVVKELFSLDLWELDAEIIKNSSLLVKPPTNDSITEIATKILAEDNIEAAKLWLPIARINAFEDINVLIALIKILIVLGNTRKKPAEGLPYRTEALVAMNWLESKSNRNDELDIFKAYKFVFKLRNAGHAIELRSIGVQASNAFKDLLLKYPENPQVILASAKAQIRTEYDMISESEWTEKLKIVQVIPLFKNAIRILLEEHTRFTI